MSKQIKALILLFIFMLSSLGTWTAAAKPAYSKTLEQIYRSKEVYRDTETALIFNKSLVVLSQNIISENGKSYISAEDAQNLGYDRLSQAAQEQLDASQTTIENIPCIPLASFAEHLGLDCRYEKAVNTYYID